MSNINWVKVITTALALAILVLAACTGPRPEEPPAAPPAIRDRATVESIDILMLESFPVQVHVIARGYLADACTEIAQIEPSFDQATNTFTVEITTSRPADAICAQVRGSFEEVIALDVYGLPAGTYTVQVNGVTGSFALDTDNILP